MAKSSLQTKDLTLTEVAALYLYVFGGESNWKKVYQAASGATEEEMAESPTKFSTYVSRWKASEKVTRELERITLLKEVMLQQERNKAFEDGKKSILEDPETTTEIRMKAEKARSEAAAARFTDYTDPERQKQKLNEIVANAKDNGEALDALKVIIQGQKNDQEAAKDKQVQRFYVPLRCYECPLYMEKKK